LENELCRIIDVVKLVGIIREVIRELLLQAVRNAVAKIRRKCANKCATLFDRRKPTFAAQVRRDHKKLPKIVAKVAKRSHSNTTSLLD